MAHEHRAKQQIASADDLIPTLVYIVCQAKLTRPFGIEKELETFAEEESLIGREAQQRALVFSAHRFILGLTPADLEMGEEEFFEQVEQHYPDELLMSDLSEQLDSVGTRDETN